MTIDAKTLGPIDPLCSFVSNAEEQIDLSVRHLLAWLKRARLEPALVPVDQTLALQLVRDNTVSTDHFLSLASTPGGLAPIIVGAWGTHTNGAPDVFIIDGRHRYVLAAYLKVSFIPSYLLTRPQWEQFLVTGLPSITREQLRRLPTAPDAIAQFRRRSATGTKPTRS